MPELWPSLHKYSCREVFAFCFNGEYLSLVVQPRKMKPMKPWPFHFYLVVNHPAFICLAENIPEIWLLGEAILFKITASSLLITEKQQCATFFFQSSASDTGSWWWCWHHMQHEAANEEMYILISNILEQLLYILIWCTMTSWYTSHNVDITLNLLL